MDDKMPIYWAFWVQQDYRTAMGAAPLTCGLAFYSEDERHMKRQAAKLPAWAMKLYDHPSRGWKSDKESGRHLLKNGWIVYSEPARLRDRSETIRLAQGDELENEIAIRLLELFDKTHKDLEAENEKNRGQTAPRKLRRH
jgi:hypothetical protein